MGDNQWSGAGRRIQVGVMRDGRLANGMIEEKLLRKEVKPW